MSKERRLGRGLEALLGRSVESTPIVEEETEVTEVQETVAFNVVSQEDEVGVTRDDEGQQWIALDTVVPNPYQPRQHFDEADIADLCDSIREHGFLQPIVVRRFDSQFQIIAGERRFRAAQLANWERVPVQVREVDDRQMAELAIVENVQRKDLNPLEKAASFQRYLQEYQCTQEELASRVHIDRSTVANLIRLLELPEPVKKMVTEGEISQGHARSLLPLGDESEQCEFAKKVKQESLSVRATEQLVQEHIRSADGDPLSIVDSEGNSRPASGTAPSQLAHLEQRLKLALGTKVDLRQSAKGRGKITIHFKNNEEFERLQAILCNGGQSAQEVV